MAKHLLLCPALVTLFACGGAGPSQPRATTARPMPEEVDERHLVMDAFGRRLHAALLAGRPTDVLLGDDEIRLILAGEAATRVAAHRAVIGMRVSSSSAQTIALSGTEYLGVCLQDARDEEESTPTGLRSRGWIFHRILVAATHGRGHRIALWVDGLFVYTDAGIGALDLERLEDPRWEHSDLEIAPCDMATALQ